MIINSENFPKTLNSIEQRLEGSVLPHPDDVALFGGTARSALLEAEVNIHRPIRDIDILPIGDGLGDDKYKSLHHKLNPDDPDTDPRIFRYPDVRSVLAENVDFTINGSVLCFHNGMELHVTPEAISAVRNKIIQPTAARIAVSQTLKEGGDATYKQYLRNETGMPARAAYFVATLRAAGFDFSHELGEHPTPDRPEDAHPFFLGLMVNKSLTVDEVERGPGDITATKIMLEVYKEMGLIEKGIPIETVEQIVKFCEWANQQKPALTFQGTEIARLVKHTDKEPEPKSD